MIMPRGEQLLLPASPWFIGLSLFLALVVNLLPTSNWIWMPDLLLLVLAFWGIHQPQRVGMGVAFFLGLLIDVQQTALLGQHALVYALVVFVGQNSSRRLLWFSGWKQALQMLPVFFGAHLLQVLIRLAAGGIFPGFGLAWAPVLESLMWPLAVAVLLAPQRRAPVHDNERPL